ncbi:hypothetical protein LOTGIDRAFT_234989 [Lottia gigantea]|uniref:C-type lectin domain-containing protein n=1 Tax=Lottia gigantea TaxID=225164 RepID=V3ZTQ3_LOTGI|nr:hypothetical protein LOTGIDRAFT_234989 [Lottia gigantea]ESO87767.1 hypothetical protein LOTGIDRAFT_234989 [Lottia gigantea]
MLSWREIAVFVATIAISLAIQDDTHFSESILCEPRCATGFTRFKTQCYVVPDASVTWGDALEFCHTFDSELVRVDDEEEQNFLEGYLTKKRASHFWIAATDLTFEGDWRWCNTMGPVVKTFWGPYQPDNKMNRKGHVQDCVVLSDRTHYRWYDEDCEQKYHFVCEKPIY